MTIMRSSEVSLNTISVLVMSVTSVVSWVRVMTEIRVVMNIMVGRWVMGIIVSRVPIIVMAMISNVVVSIVVFSNVETVVFMSMMESVMIVMMIHWLHLKDQVTTRCVYIRWVENGRVSLKST